MARKSRIKDNYGTYHIRQRGSGQVPLFVQEADRQEFLRIVQLVARKNNFQVKAFCLADPDRYDLILDANGCDVSKVMKEINIRYSLYKNCDGCLFRDRFRSELLSTAVDPTRGSVEPDASLETVGSVQSCQDLVQQLSQMTVLDTTSFESLPGDLERTYQRGCQERIETVAEARARLDRQLTELELTLPLLKKDKARRNEMIRSMKACSTLSLRQIGEVFGGLSESSVSKIVNEES